MSENVLSLKLSINYTLLIQLALLTCLGFMLIIVSGSWFSLLFSITGIGLLLYTRFVYSPRQIIQFSAYVALGFLCAILGLLVIYHAQFMQLFLVIMMCFLCGFAVFSRNLLVLVASIFIGVMLNYHGLIELKINLLYELTWFLGGVVCYLLTTFIFSRRIDNQKIVASRQVDKVILNSWEVISKLDAPNDLQSWELINTQIDNLVVEITRLKQVKLDYAYYCKRDSMLDNEISSNLNKLIGFHELVSNQVYNTMLTNNQQLIANDFKQQTEELND